LERRPSVRTSADACTRSVRFLAANVHRNADTMTTSFAERLEHQLKARRMSGRALAEAMKVNKMTVVRWRRGENEPRQANARAAAAALKIPASTLLLDEEEADALTPTVGAEASAPGPTRRPSDDATALVNRIAALDLESTAEALRRVVPDLMTVLADARAYAEERRRQENGL